jgi:hypothetical protein
MKKWMLVFCVLMILISNGLSQTNQTPPATQPAASPAPQTSSGGQNRPTAEQQRQQNAQIDAAFDALRSLEIPLNVEKSVAEILRQEIQPLYRKPSKKELKNLLPSQALLTQYEKFLKQPETGIFKLSADSNCAINTNVVVATESCLSKDIPGSGTAYSFRVKSHRILRFSDLILEKNVVKTDSLLQQGVMVNLGNIGLDEVSTQTNGLRYLFDFKPATSKEELLSIDQTLNKGVKFDGFVYAYSFFVENNTTFALRSIAYRGKVLRSIDGFKYNEMDFDKRKDITVVFRIVEKDANGDLTILWKEISRKDSPVIKIDEKDK